ncbi:MAG: holo-ACP synthase [Limisphaerales bacterium]
MILGIGIDLVEVDRIHRSLERFSDRFLRRILRAAEIDYCLSCKHPATHVAARFAAKEAISKAFGTGIGRDLGWLDMEIRRAKNGGPTVVLHGAGQELLTRRGGRIVHVSLSHTDHHATAIAIIEGG